MMKQIIFAAAMMAAGSAMAAPVYDAGKYRLTLTAANAEWTSVLKPDFGPALTNKQPLGSSIFIDHDGGELDFSIRVRGMVYFPNSPEIKQTHGAIWFDDGGSGPDWDFDDMQVSVAPVPVPAAFGLLAFALAGLGAARLRGGA